MPESSSPEVPAGRPGRGLLTAGLLVALMACSAPSGGSSGATAPILAAPGRAALPTIRPDASTDRPGAPAPGGPVGARSDAAPSPSSLDRDAGPADERGRAPRDAAATPRRFSAYYPPERALGARAWEQAHAARGDASAAECWDMSDRVGVPPAPGMLCLSRVDDPPETIATIYRLEGARLRSVWRGTIGAWANWLELVPLLSDDGATLELRESSPGGCEAALAEHREKRSSGVAGNFGAVLDRGCALRGLHMYRDGRYVQGLGLAPSGLQ